MGIVVLDMAYSKWSIFRLCVCEGGNSEIYEPREHKNCGKTASQPREGKISIPLSTFQDNRCMYICNARSMPSIEQSGIMY